MRPFRGLQRRHGTQQDLDDIMGSPNGSDSGERGKEHDSGWPHPQETPSINTGQAFLDDRLSAGRATTVVLPRAMGKRFERICHDSPRYLWPPTGTKATHRTLVLFEPPAAGRQQQVKPRTLRESRPTKGKTKDENQINTREAQVTGPPVSATGMSAGVGSQSRRLFSACCRSVRQVPCQHGTTNSSDGDR